MMCVCAFLIIIGAKSYIFYIDVRKIERRELYILYDMRCDLKALGGPRRGRRQIDGKSIFLDLNVFDVDINLKYTHIHTQSLAYDYERLRTKSRSRPSVI